jgi:hypothetical protein
MIMDTRPWIRTPGNSTVALWASVEIYLDFLKGRFTR